MKRVIALLTAVVLCFACCACDNKDGNDEVVTITWLMCGDKQVDQAAVNEKINEITMKKINAKLDIQYIDMGAYTERMTMNMASGTADYDMCFVGFNNPYDDAAKKGGLLDITEMLKDHPDLVESIPDYFWEGATIDGKIYAVPNVQVAATATALCVKKDLADEYGLNLDDINYAQDLEPFLEWVKTNHPEVYPYRTTNGIIKMKDKEQTYSIATGVYAEVDENGKVVVKTSYEDEDFGENLRLIRDWYNKGYIRKDNAVATDDTQDYNAGKFAAWCLTYKPGVEAEIYTSKGYEAYAKQMNEQYLTGLVGTSTMMGINPNSKNPEKTLEMIELIQTDEELYNLICFGIEGKHYQVVDDRIVSDKQAGYQPTMTWRFGNQFNARLIEGQPDGVWEATEEFNNTAKRVLVGFVFDTTPVRTEIAQLSTVAGKYAELNKGTVDFDKVKDKYVAELKTAGIEKVAAEAQKQIDKFLANKK